MTHEPFGEIPLFRELQRLLQAGGGGPINREIARQVASAVALEGRSEPAPLPQETHSYAELVHGAEAVLAGYTRLEAPEPLQARVVSRSWWVTATLDAWGWVLDRLARRFTAEMGRLGPEAAGGQAEPIASMMGQIAPLMMGLQVGALIGQLAREQLGRYDLPIPRDDDGHLFLVTANAETLARDHELEPHSIKGWLAVNDAARGLIENSVPWFGPYFRSLLGELVDSLEIDVSALERRLVELQSQDLSSLQEQGGLRDVLPIVPSERHGRALDRVRAFVALFEGYAHHSCAEVAPQVLPDFARLEEVMARRAAEPSDGERMLTDLLGLSSDRALEASGHTFCAAVTSLKGLATLNRAWAAPDYLPSTAEIRDPFLWIERVTAE